MKTASDVEFLSQRGLESVRQVLCLRIGECIRIVRHVRGDVTERFWEAPPTLVEFLSGSDSRLQVKADAIEKTLQELKDVPRFPKDLIVEDSIFSLKPIFATRDVIGCPNAIMLRKKNTLDNQVAAWIAALVDCCKELEDKLTTLLHFASSPSVVSLPACSDDSFASVRDISSLVRIVFNTFKQLQHTKRHPLPEDALSFEQSFVLLNISRVAADFAAQKMADYPMTATGPVPVMRILPPEPESVPDNKASDDNRPRIPAISLSSFHRSPSTDVPGRSPRSEPVSARRIILSDRSSSTLCGSSPGNVWISALNIVDEVMQDSLVLQGKLFFHVIEKDKQLDPCPVSVQEVSQGGVMASSQSSSHSGVLKNPRWLTNARNNAIIQVFTSKAKDAELETVIDLRTVQSIYYVKPSHVTDLQTLKGRLMRFALETPTTIYEMEAGSEADAIYWMLGLKRIMLNPDDGVPAWRLAPNKPLSSTPSDMPDVDLFQSPAVRNAENSMAMLQVTQRYLQRKLEESSEELNAVEHSLRNITSYAELMHQQYFNLSRRKAMLQHLRDDYNSQSEEVESKIAARRPGTTKSHSSAAALIPARFNQKLSGTWDNLFTTDGGAAASVTASVQFPLLSGRTEDKEATALESVIASFGSIWSAWMASDSYIHLPLLKVSPAQKQEPVFVSVQSPEAGGGEVSHDNSMFGKVITCYPLTEAQVKALGYIPDTLLPNEGELAHVGDPICDQFCFKAIGDRAIMVLADGCNWGKGPRNAARCASATFAEYMAKHSYKISDTNKAGDILVMALAAASDQIALGQESWETGTTTLAGGILLKCTESTMAHKYIWVGISCGDCKMMLYSHADRNLTDITECNRSNITDASDPGGRLGPYILNKYPDLRNLMLYMKVCEEDDLLFIMSDGVHDNFDPQHFGIPPKDYDLHYDTWEEASEKAFNKARTTKAMLQQRYMLKAINDALPDPKCPVEPEILVRALINFAVKTTASSRKFMCENPKKKLPHDYEHYPGKLDHTSCICLKVGAPYHL